MSNQDSLSSIARLRAKLPHPLHSLADLAFNFWWSWSHEGLSLFRDVDDKWEEYRRNPVKLLDTVSQERLAQLATEPDYCKRVEGLVARFEQYMQATDTWASRVAPEISLQQPVAYFCIEYGFGPCLPTYSGGLGILAADHIKSASDLGLPLVGVGLLYRHGYFRQSLNAQGWQEENYLDYQFEELPLELCKDEQGETLIITVQIGDLQVAAQIWQLQVGRVKVYLLDTDREGNAPLDRRLTGTLYGSGQETRIAQEYLLGIGGVRALQRLGIEPQIYHLNEGHAAFAMLEVARLEMERTGKSFDEVKETVRRKGVFTTHTPVPAGHDTFSLEQMEHYFDHYWPQLNLEQQEFIDLGNHSEDFGEPFNMTVLALRLCRAANGVSRLNGEVCREMWSVLYPDRPVEQVPIGYITNGVHARTWTAPLMADLYAKYLDSDWASHMTDTQMWDSVDKIPARELWWCHVHLKESLVAYTRAQVQQARANRGESAQVIAAAERLLDPKVLTLGFARRFSAYKRGYLIIQDPERARALLGNPDRPVQMIFAGKAHPADEESKHIIQQLIEWSRHSDIQDRMVFLEDYDMHIAEKLIQGVDVWLNTPRRLQEASGTSGQKAGFNGGLNCSILDGWWYEAYQTGLNGKGLNGWAIGDGRDDELEAQDQRDAQILYQLLESEIIPCYYDQDDEEIPRRWIEMIKASIKTIAPYFNTDRMVAEYVSQMYLPSSTAAHPVGTRHSTKSH